MDCEPKFKIVDKYFPNGNKYTTQVFESGVLVRIKKFFITGELESLCEYENGLLISKKIYGKNQKIKIFISYYYDNNNEIYKITKEEEYTSSQAIFHRERDNKISEIIVKINNDVSRRINFEYGSDSIKCFDTANKSLGDYKLYLPPKADDSWLISNSPQSLVMRKLKMARAMIA